MVMFVFITLISNTFPALTKFIVKTEGCRWKRKKVDYGDICVNASVRSVKCPGVPV